MRRVLASLLALLLAGCSSLGMGSGGDRLLVRLYDARNNLRLELSNESNPDLGDVYSNARKDAALKLAPDALMQELIASLDQLGFPALARPGAAPEGAAGIRGWVEVLENGASRAFVVPETGATAEELGSFVRIKLTVSEYYTHIGGLQFIENPNGAQLLKQSPYRGGS